MDEFILPELISEQRQSLITKRHQRFEIAKRTNCYKMILKKKKILHTLMLTDANLSMFGVIAN